MFFSFLVFCIDLHIPVQILTLSSGKIMKYIKKCMDLINIIRNSWILIHFECCRQAEYPKTLFIVFRMFFIFDDFLLCFLWISFRIYAKIHENLKKFLNESSFLNSEINILKIFILLKFILRCETSIFQWKLWKIQNAS